MAAIIKRLSDIEADLEELRRKKIYIPVLFVTEYTKGIYTRFDGKVFGNEAELKQYAKMHDTETIIIDDIRKGNDENNIIQVGSIRSPQSGKHSFTSKFC